MCKEAINKCGAPVCPGAAATPCGLSADLAAKPQGTDAPTETRLVFVPSAAKPSTAAQSGTKS